MATPKTKPAEVPAWARFGQRLEHHANRLQYGKALAMPQHVTTILNEVTGGPRGYVVVSRAHSRGAPAAVHRVMLPNGMVVRMIQEGDVIKQVTPIYRKGGKQVRVMQGPLDDPTPEQIRERIAAAHALN